LATFTFLAFGFSWSIAFPLALAHLGVLPEIIPTWTHYLIPVDPALSTLVVTAVLDGIAGLKTLGRRLLRWGCPKWWIVSFSPLILAFLLKLLLSSLTGSQLRLSSLGSLNFLPPLGMWALLIWIATFGLCQEIAWRGFALPRLQKKRSALTAAMVLALIWILWALPQFFYFSHHLRRLSWWWV
jgi:membrane protease YdiL (CAAX protease family)